MKSPLLSTNRPLYVDLPSGQCGAAPHARLHAGATQLSAFLLLLQMLTER